MAPSPHSKGDPRSKPERAKGFREAHNAQTLRREIQDPNPSEQRVFEKPTTRRHFGNFETFLTSESLGQTMMRDDAEACEDVPIVPIKSSPCIEIGS
jgi:hypothetical protein